MAVSIKDVAKHAGVSAMTVSRVVNGKKKVGKATREKVARTIRALNYRPNKIAQSLVLKRSEVLSLVIPDTANPFFAEMARGVQDYARTRGYSVILCDTGGHADLEKELVEISLRRMSDGLILVAPRMSDESISEISKFVPLVVVDRAIPGKRVLQVYIDNKDGARQATNHLIDLGHQRIGFVEGPANVLNSLRRKEGFLAALKERGTRMQSSLMKAGDFHVDSGYEAMKKFLQNRHLPTAIFASNDLMAFGLIVRAREGNVRVPDDLSIVGFDDIYFSSFSNPPLTTVRVPKFEMGVHAVKLLLSRLSENQPIPDRENLRDTLVIRESTARAPLQNHGLTGTRG